MSINFFLSIEFRENGRSEGHTFLEASINIRAFLVYCQIWVNIVARSLRIMSLSKSGRYLRPYSGGATVISYVQTEVQAPP
jgi:hypothetical protein